jgi:CBS domain-containing protein
MEEWLDEAEFDSGSEREGAARVLDQRMIQEPVWRLNPRPPIALAPDATLREAIDRMRECRIGCLLVVERDVLVGILTERDLLLKLDADALDQPVRELMTPDPETLAAEDPIVYALNKMSVGGFRHVPLVDAEGHPVGIVSVKDIVDYIVDFFSHDVLNLPPDPARAERWSGRDGG